MVIHGILEWIVIILTISAFIGAIAILLAIALFIKDHSL